MPKNAPDSPFSETQEDLSALKQTALDAVDDVTKTAAGHAKKAQKHLGKLADHFQDEGREQLGQFKASLSDAVSNARDIIVERPFVCLGVALAIGLIIGLTRRSTRD